MQKSRNWMFLPLCLAALALGCNAQQKQVLSPPGEASVSFADGKTVTIKYSRPSARGRKIFGGLVPYGHIWRTGANAATSFSTDVNLDIGGTAVPAGNYTIYTLPEQNGWKLIVNKQTGQWGTVYDESQDLARIPMKVTQTPAATEMFTISLDKTGGDAATLKLQWENSDASVSVKEKK